MRKPNNDPQYRPINMERIERRSKGNDEMIVEGYATTFNNPYTLIKNADYIVNEQIDPTAFNACDMSDVVMQYDHKGHVVARTSNGTLKITPDNKGLHIRAELNGTEIGREIYEEIAGGYTTKMSFSFQVAADKRDTWTDKETGHTVILRTITKISKLYDVSAVSMPANDETTITGAE